MNKDKCKDFDLLNNYIKFNLQNIKFTEVKLYVNNNYIIKIGIYSFYIYKDLFDVNYQLITDIKKIDIENYIVDDYYSNYYGNDGVIIRLYSYLYLKNNNNMPRQTTEIEHKEIEHKEIEYNNNITTEYIKIENIEKSTILNENENVNSTILENELDILNWINN